MKKAFQSITYSFFVLLAVALLSPTQAKASIQAPDSKIVTDYIEKLEDGSYYHITISENESSSISRSIQTRNGSREITYHDPDGVALWKYTLYGTFQYNPGASSTCISSSYTINIYDDNWENTSASSSKSGNRAIGEATFIKKVLFITTHEENVHATLSCDSYGNLS